MPSESSVKQDDVVLLALHNLEGARKKVFSEHVAAEANRLAPAIFGWELPEFRKKGWPDKEKVRVALIRLRSNDGGRLVDGQYTLDVSKDGWKLTQAGVRWLNENESRVLAALQQPSSKLPKKQTQRFLQQIRRDPLFKLFAAEGLDGANRYQFTDMLNCSPDATQEVLNAKFERLRAMAEDSAQPDVIEFLVACTPLLYDGS